MKNKLISNLVQILKYFGRGDETMSDFSKMAKTTRQDRKSGLFMQQDLGSKIISLFRLRLSPAHVARKAICSAQNTIEQLQRS